MLPSSEQIEPPREIKKNSIILTGILFDSYKNKKRLPHFLQEHGRGFDPLAKALHTCSLKMAGDRNDRVRVEEVKSHNNALYSNRIMPYTLVSNAHNHLQ